VNTDRLIVVVQVYGPIDTNGAFGASGKTATVGRVVPRVLANGPDKEEVVDEADELEAVTEDACLAFTPTTELEVEADRKVVGDEDAEDDVGSASGVRAPRELEERLTVVVEEGIALLYIEVGMATGQNDHTLRPSSQYKSTSNLRNPTASRFERQSPELSSSYLKWGKQAAERDTPGAVT
jgi:hypothetical protein